MPMVDPQLGDARPRPARASAETLTVTRLGGLVGFSQRHAAWMAALALVLVLLSVVAAATRLGVSTDTDRLFRASLPWRQRQIALARAFPGNDGLVAVITARIPEEADATAAALAQALAHDPAHFTAVSRPDASAFLRHNALLFLDLKPLNGLLNSIIAAQPFLGQLAADPSARGLFSALSLIGLGVQHGQADLAAYAPALDGFQRALAAAADGHPQPLSWQNLLAGPLVKQAGQFRFVLAQPVQNFNALEPGQAATDALRAAAARLPFIQNGDAHLGITGGVALADQEFATVAEGVVWGTLGSVILITLWLFLAVGSWRLIVPILLTLLLGLSLTTGFASLAVGTLNLVSVAFAVLFVGIAVDFAIQFSVRYREARETVPDIGAALVQTGQRAGGQILVAAAATAAGFYAFVPTNFAGVAELGLIAGTGMLIAFVATLFFLPAFLTLFRARGGRGETGLAVLNAAEQGLARVRRPALLVFGLLGLLGLVLLPRLHFDSDPLHTKDPHTESMRVLRKLINDPNTNPYTIDIIEPSAQAAGALADRLGRLPLVARALSIESFVPTDQAPKLAAIADAATILGPTLAAPPAGGKPPDAADLRQAIIAARAQLDAVRAKLPPDSPLLGIDADLARLATAPDATLLAMNRALTEFLPQQLATLADVLNVSKVTLADIPPSLARQWVLPDGRARVNVMPKAMAEDSAGLHHFVTQVRAIAPNAGGAAVTIVETAATIIGAFRNAAIGALLAIAVLLFAFLRRPRVVALVMAPLLLSALMTVVVLVSSRMVLNFANIIALPLLLGVGVSFNIYFVMNWRAGARRFLGTGTARAVLFSAATTGTAFGSLALSHHPGTASMGYLLLISLGCTLVATFMFLPALLLGMEP